MNKNNYAVIMAGGIGSRFWPMSKTTFPKQFLDILGTDETLIQQTFNRLERVCPAQNIFVVTNVNYKKLCLEQLPNVIEGNILCEPAMRNTAPCVGYAAFKIQSLNQKANMIIAASDHIITKEDEFVRVVNDCLKLTAKNDRKLIEEDINSIKESKPEPTEEERLQDEAYREEKRQKKYYYWSTVLCCRCWKVFNCTSGISE